MTTTSPINGLPGPDDDSPNDPPIHFDALIARIDNRLVPPFDTVTDRDNAFTAWVAAGNTLTEGMYSFTRADHRLWVYDGSIWTWPKWSQGEIGYIQRTTQAGPVVNSDGQVAISGVSVSFTLPSARKIRTSLSGQAVSNVAGTLVVLWLHNTTTTKQKPFIVSITQANQGGGVALWMRESLSAGTYTVRADLSQLSGPGGAYTTTDPLELIVEDMGAV